MSLAIWAFSLAISVEIRQYRNVRSARFSDIASDEMR